MQCTGQRGSIGGGVKSVCCHMVFGGNMLRRFAGSFASISSAYYKRASRTSLNLLLFLMRYCVTRRVRVSRIWKDFVRIWKRAFVAGVFE